MPDKKRKIFPKLNKKLKGFLTDESGKITKKDALGLSVGAVLLGGIDEVAAGHGNHGSHSSGPSGHLSQGHASGNLRSGHVNVDPGAVTKTSHASGIVNGHYSGTPNGGIYDPAHANGYGNGGHLSQGHANGYGHGNHANHVSHQSHGSGGWC